MARSSRMAEMHKMIDGMDTSKPEMKRMQDQMRDHLNSMEAEHEEQMKSANQQVQTAKDQVMGVKAGLRVSGPEGMEGEELEQFMEDADQRRRDRLMEAPFSAGELEALTDPLYQQGGAMTDPLDPRPVRTPLEAAVDAPNLMLNRARRI
jgi:hypothetical protein